MNIRDQILDIEEDKDILVVYLTKYGSRLYGTDTPESDTDYKGVFIPRQMDVLLKRDIPFFSTSTGSNISKNSKEDVDLHLDSIYKWIEALGKGETGAIDLLFSIFRKDTQVIASEKFIGQIKANYLDLFGRNLSAFVGYCISQSRKSGIKGTRYGELKDLLKQIEKMSTMNNISPDTKLIDLKFNLKKYKHISMVKLQGPNSKTNVELHDYIDVLGKKYNLESTSLYRLTNKLTELKSNYGNRAKKVTDGICYKSLSHSLRVILEVEELLETKFIKFPLSYAEDILDIKNKKLDEKQILDLIEDKIKRIDTLMETTKLNKEQNKDIADMICLHGVEQRNLYWKRKYI